jgi:uncharacterized RDD family membrane protein YckC
MMNSPETPSEKVGPSKAGLLNRVIAKAIDFIIIGAMLEIIPVAGYFAGLVYLLIADGLMDGKSVGKWLIGLRVVVKDSEPLRSCGFSEAIIRNILFAAVYLLFGLLMGIPLIGWILSFAVIAAAVMFEGLIMFGSEDGSRFGDEIAKTWVIEEK